jgi:hypothetical protein
MRKFATPAARKAPPRVNTSDSESDDLRDDDPRTVFLGKLKIAAAASAPPLAAAASSSCTRAAAMWLGNVYKPIPKNTSLAGTAFKVFLPKTEPMHMRSTAAEQKMETQPTVDELMCLASEEDGRDACKDDGRPTESSSSQPVATKKKIKREHA